MKDKTTGELGGDLMSACSIEAYLRENEENFCEQDVAKALTALYERVNETKAALARRSGMSEVYLHQVFSGRRNPSRDRLLCLCLGLRATLEETQGLLKQAAYAPLYPKNRRDAIITYGLLHQMELHTINDKLFEMNERTLF